MDGEDNKFVQLCVLASKEGWCWKLFCTTCGHMYFRYAFRELASGASPSSEQWITHKNNRKYLNKLGSLPKDYSESEKEEVLKTCLDADLSIIAQSCKFPDWLGYLGLVMDHMYTGSETYHAVSSGWAAQLKGMVPQGSRASARMEEILAGRDELLRIDDLEMIEKSMMSL